MCDKIKLLQEINQKIRWELIELNSDSEPSGTYHMNILDLLARSDTLIKELT